MKPKLPFPIPSTEELNPKHVKNCSLFIPDIPYAKQSGDQTLDLYLPDTGSAPYPLIIFIHEGAFAFGSKRDARMAAVMPLLGRGCAVASVDYRKSGAVSWPAPVYDVKAAVRHLRSNAGVYMLDPSRFCAWGMSAGAYLAAMLGVSCNQPAFEDLEMGSPDSSSEVQLVVDWFGPCAGFHLLDGQIKENGHGKANHSDANSPESLLMGSPLGNIPELCRLAAPIAHVHPAIPPFLIQHGIRDPITPVQQSKLFAGEIQLIAGKEKARLIIYDSGHYSKPIYSLPEAGSAVYGFIEKHFLKTHVVKFPPKETINHIKEEKKHEKQEIVP